MGTNTLLSPKGHGTRSKQCEEPWTRTIVTSENCPKEMLPKQDAWKPSDFDITKTLFVGKRSVIYRAKCNGMDLVLKVYVKNRLAAVHRKQVEREIQIHSSISHPNIVNLYAAFEDENHVYLMIESANKGDLLDDMNKRETFYPQEAIVRFASQILDALNYLHKKGIMHRDMKPENIVIMDSNHTIKLIDFGLSIDYSRERPVSAVGTLQYMAPEVVVCPTKSRPEENKDNPLLQYGTGADIWAVGVLVYELCTGRAPFDTGKKATERETEQRIMYMEPDFPKNMDADAADFIKKSISKVALRRPSAAELLNHKWVTRYTKAPRESAKPPVGSSHQGIVVDAGTPHESLRPQLSMMNVKGERAENPVVAPERSFTVGTAADEWMYSDERLKKPVPTGLQVTGTSGHEEPVGREEFQESDKDSAFMRSTGSCSQSAKSPGKAPGGSVRRVAGGTSTLDLADSGPPLHAASSLAKGHHRQGGAATVTPTGPADVPARSIQQRLGRGNGSASLTLDLRLPASVVSNRTAGYPGSGSPRSSMVPVGAGGLRSGKQVEAALRHSLLLAESSAPALASSLSADKSVPHLAESLSVGSMAFRANARGQAFDPHSSILSPGGGVVGGASGLVRPSMRHIASVQRPVSGMHGKHQQLGGISFERSTLVNYQQAGPSKAPAFARWTPGAGGLRAWVADQGGSGLVRSPPSRGVHQRQQPNGSGRPASSHMALNKGTKDMVSGAKALDFSHRYNIAIPSQRA